MKISHALKSIPDEELQNEYQRLYSAICIHDCYGVIDLIEYNLIAGELKRRGYQAVKSVKLIRSA